MKKPNSNDKSNYIKISASNENLIDSSPSANRTRYLKNLNSKEKQIDSNSNQNLNKSKISNINNLILKSKSKENLTQSDTSLNKSASNQSLNSKNIKPVLKKQSGSNTSLNSASNVSKTTKRSNQNVAQTQFGINKTTSKSSLNGSHKSSNQSINTTNKNSSVKSLKSNSNPNLSAKTQSNSNLNKSISVSKSSIISSKLDNKNVSEIYETIDYENERLSKSSSKKSEEKSKILFRNMWLNQKRLYLNIQMLFLIFNLISTLVFIGFSIWINIDERFLIFTNLSNRMLYSSFNRLIGYLPYVCLVIGGLDFFVDFNNFLLHFFIKRFLNAHDEKQINYILNNQKILAQMSLSNLNNAPKSLRLRGIIRYSIRKTKRSIRFVTLVNVFFYIFILIAAKMFLGIYIHELSYNILNYQLPNTLLKLVKEYEKQQISELTKNDMIIYKMRNVPTYSTEEKLMDSINIQFECCNYQNPYQFGDMAPGSCNFKQGCLNPMQEFMWNYLYFGVIIFLTTAAFKLCCLFILVMNFKIILMNRLIRKLYNVDVRKYRTYYKELNSSDDSDVNDVGDKKNVDLNEDDDGDDDEDKQTKLAKLREIREQRYEMLQKEEEEENIRKQKEEEELNRFLEQEKRQDAYELVLIKQKRFDELRYQQRQRRLQQQHFYDMQNSVENV